jgi:hypothetical protein
VTYQSATQIQATVPVNLQSATYNITVVNASDLLGTRASLYSVYAPVQSNLALTAEFGNNQDRSGTISALNVDTMTLIETKNLGPSSNGQDVAVRKDGTLALAACWGGTVRAFLPTTRAVVPGGVPRMPARSSSIRPATRPCPERGQPQHDPSHRPGLVHVTGTATIGSGQFYSPVDDLQVSPDGSQLFATNSGAIRWHRPDESDMVELADPRERLPASGGLDRRKRAPVSNHESDTISGEPRLPRTINVSNPPVS